MEAEDAGAGHQAENGEGQAGAGGPGSQDRRGGHEGPGRGGRGEAGAVAPEVPQAAEALEAPVGGAEAQPAAMARVPRPPPLQFSILVPFHSPMEAEIAYHLLFPRVRLQLGAAHQRITVSGSLLTIRLTAEDTDQLRLYISICAHELFLLIQSMWHTLPPFFFINPKRGNRS